MIVFEFITFPLGSTSRSSLTYAVSRHVSGYLSVASTTFDLMNIYSSVNTQFHEAR